MSKKTEEGMTFLRFIGDLGGLDKQAVLDKIKESAERAGITPPTQEELQELYLKIKKHDANRSRKRK